MLDGVKITALGVLTLLFAMAANYGTDPAYQLHALFLMALSVHLLRKSVKAHRGSNAVNRTQS